MDITGRDLTHEIDMLHCKPSQIQLTSADVNDLEHRIHAANRRRAFSDVTKGKARLSTGPRLPTIIAAAHVEDGITVQYASTSTLYSPTRSGDETTKRLRYAIPVREASAMVLRPHLQHSSQLAPTPDVEPVKVDSPRTSPSPPPRLTLPKLDVPWDTSIRHRRRQTSPSHHAVTTYDGADDSGDVHFPRPQPTATPSAPLHAGREVFRELPGGSTTALPPHTSPCRSPGGRARRSKLRSQESVALSQDISASLSSAQDTSRDTTRPRHGHEHGPPTTHIAQDLDPGAAVFTPRVRFGSTAMVPDSAPAGTDSTDTSNLRHRTPSEQNASPSMERRPQANTPSQETRPRRLRSNAVVSRSRRSSENSALPLPNLERYPLLLPNARSAFERERREPSSSVTSEPQIAAASSPSNDGLEDASSTPDQPSSRIPSIVSAASGISGLSISDDAAAEFLRFRSSPLDGLTAELSRLSTALGPATKSTDNRISLLNGNPFDSNHATIHEELSGPEETSELQHPSRENISSRLLASPSRLTLTSSPPQPSTPLPHPTASPAQIEPPHYHSTIRLVNPSTSAATPAQPTATVPTATPKLPIYNDFTPARFQPQTPADITRSSRRARNRSDSSVHREAFCVGQVLVARRPVAVPERRAYRNTYPTNAPVGGVRVVAGDARRDGDGNGAENEMEGQLAGLESERAVWSRRRQGGSLDVTPPGVGRLERFLH
jgi:hypothetical protein